MAMQAIVYNRTTEEAIIVAEGELKHHQANEYVVDLNLKDISQEIPLLACNGGTDEIDPTKLRLFIILT